MFRYTALGDSITAGENATSPARAYPGLVVSFLQKREGGAVGVVLAEPGWTSEALTAAVLEESPLPLQTANAVSIWVGGDDIAAAGLAILRGAPATVFQQYLAQYGRNLEVLVQTIRRISRARIVLCGQYNPFPNTALVAQGMAALNELTASVAGRLHTAYAPTDAWFAGRQAELIAGYRTGRIEDVLAGGSLPIHPNDCGHLVIAKGLVGLVDERGE